MPANMARSACAGASFTRSFTCGTRISHSPRGRVHTSVPQPGPARCFLVNAGPTFLRYWPLSPMEEVGYLFGIPLLPEQFLAVRVRLDRRFRAHRHGVTGGRLGY